KTLAVELARAGDQPGLELAGAAPFAHDQVAQQALSTAAVIWLERPRAAPPDDPLARRRARLGRQQAVTHLEDLVPPPAPAETADQMAVVVGAERVLELVAVAPLLDRGNDRFELKGLELADPLQGVGDLRLLDLELAFVGQHLPRRAGMVGDRWNSFGT